MIRVGQKFREERVKKGLSIQDVAARTKIRPSFITAIERGEYGKIPSASYAKGFVRNYSEFLGLPTGEMLALFRREFDTEKSYRVLPETYVKQQDIPMKRTNVQLTMLILIAVLVLVAGFLLYQYRGAFFSPALTVTQPKGSIVTTQEVEVVGKADPSSTITVNGAPVAVDTNGNFTKTISVFPGKTDIVVRAKNRLGKETVIDKVITVQVK